MTKYLFLLLFIPFSLYADEQKFQFPVDCELGKNCYIQLYVDNGTTEQVIDFKGGYLTNDKHTGTDIALATYQDMEQGINVLAAAGGTVINTRDGEPDHYSRNYQFDEKKACGNGVMVRHGPLWTTQYCHLKKGSITVKAGEEIKAGQKIGLIGSSGHADFPHVHFTIRHYGKVVDPFPSNLWTSEISYVPFGTIDMGMVDHRISVNDVLNHAPRQKQFTADDDYMIAWIRVYGVEENDLLRFRFYTPNKTMFGSPKVIRINNHYKEWFTASGFKTSPSMLKHLKGQWLVKIDYQRTGNTWQPLGEMNFTLE